MVFDGREGPHFISPHNDPLVVEMKVASAVVRRILIDNRCSVDIISWDCLKKLKHSGREIALWYTSFGAFGARAEPHRRSPALDKKPEALLIHMLSSTELNLPCPDAVSLEDIPLDEGRPDHMPHAPRPHHLHHQRHGLTIKGHGLLIITSIVFIGWGRHEIHQFRIPTLGLSLMVVLDALNVHLNVAFLAKARSSRIPKRILYGPHAFISGPTVALAALSFPIIVSASILTKRRLYLAANSSKLWHSVWRSPICPRRRALELWRSQIYISKAEIDSVDLIAFNAWAKACKRHDMIS
ncbi:hypothetical protein Cgig2_018904 [Carnegiea gigantea]|uniref:Uncharacterized protein n=1 Tax=Carnegiea gigantea TaxID=171969 RepID=A0A9Q1K5D3_9CARY|nr:hypothetical protein Cgig2_018904 [Carnegiea gigantea]